MGKSSKPPVAAPVAAPEPPKRKPVDVRKRPGPKPLVLQDLSSTLQKIESMSPSERQAHRTKLGESLVDAWMVRATERLLSDKVRSQDLVAVAGFLRANQFIVSPSKEGVEDPLAKLMRERKAADAEEALRLKRMAKAKAIEEERVAAFYRKQSGEPITPRLNAGDPGAIMEGDIESDEQQ